MARKNKKENNNGFHVLDYDGKEIPMDFGEALEAVKNYSAEVIGDKTIRLSEKLIDGNGFSVKRGWRDDHASSSDSWTYSPSDIKRDSLLSFDTLREIYRRSSHVRPAIDSIVKEIAHLPIKIDGRGKARVEDFINRPNISKETWPTLFHSFLIDLLVLDQAIIEKVRNMNGDIVEIYVRDASQFRPMLDSSRSYICYFKQDLVDKAGRVKSSISHDVDDLIWVRQFPRSYSSYGTPIIETIIDEVSALMFASKSIAKYFVDDEIPPGILHLETIGRKAYERAKAQFEANRGESGKKRINVIDNVGSAGWVSFTRPFREMQLAELTLIIEQVVNKNFGVSSADLGDAQGLTRATVDRLYKTGRSKLFRPLVNLIANKLNKELISEISPNAKLSFVLEPVVDASTAREMSDAGIITKNEARKALNFDPVPGGDRLAVRVGNQYLVLDDDGGVPTGISNNEISNTEPTALEDNNISDESSDDITDNVDEIEKPDKKKPKKKPKKKVNV
tara:strand:- start:7962 stop:9479 length:1518 start_codon:yes stop_codon:yes gene_type:complete